MKDTERGRDTGRGRSRFHAGLHPRTWGHALSQRWMLTTKPPRHPPPFFLKIFINVKKSTQANGEAEGKGKADSPLSRGPRRGA